MDHDLVEIELTTLIEQVGKDHVVLVVCDGASPNVLAMSNIQEKYPRVSCIRCMAHLTQLLFKDVAQTGYFTVFVDLHKDIANYVKVHDFIWGKFLEHSKNILGNELRPIKYGETRYASWFRVMERNLKLKEVYMATIGDSRVVAWVRTQQQPTQDAYASMEQKITDEEGTWRDCKVLVECMMEPFLLLKLFDGDTPCLGKVRLN